MFLWFINRNNIEQVCYTLLTVTTRFLECDDEHSIINKNMYLSKCVVFCSIKLKENILSDLCFHISRNDTTSQ